MAGVPIGNAAHAQFAAECLAMAVGCMLLTRVQHLCDKPWLAAERRIHFKVLLLLLSAGELGGWIAKGGVFRYVCVCACV